MDKTQSWSIIIFCYNEEGCIAKIIQDAYDLAENLIPGNYEILIVNDGSNDKTGLIANEFSRKYKTINIINHSNNLGIGGALRSGYMNAKNENVCAVPADGQFDLNELAPYVNILDKTFLSFHRKNKASYSSYRTILSLMNKKFNRYFLSLKMKDVNWVKIYKLDELKKLDLQMKSSLIETEICAKLLINSNTMIEVPSTYHPRIAGKVQGATLKEIKKIVREIYKLTSILRIFRRNISIKN